MDLRISTSMMGGQKSNATFGYFWLKLGTWAKKYQKGIMISKLYIDRLNLTKRWYLCILACQILDSSSFNLKIWKSCGSQFLISVSTNFKTASICGFSLVSGNSPRQERLQDKSVQCWTVLWLEIPLGTQSWKGHTDASVVAGPVGHRRHLRNCLGGRVTSVFSKQMLHISQPAGQTPSKVQGFVPSNESLVSF